jgi:hypothetical protein
MKIDIPKAKICRFENH